MDCYPDDYLAHNLPLIILSGLENEVKPDISGKTRNLLHEGGFRLKVDAPPVGGKTAEALLTALLEYDAHDVPWNSLALSNRDGKVYKIECVGRTHSLPPRKAPPPPHSPKLTADNKNSSPPTPLILHSTLSPLTPSSPLYPDGIITPHWITKHQSRLPSAFITFFTLAADSSSGVVQDNKLKTEINSLRNVLTSTNYKTKLVIVLLGDGEIDSSESGDRLGAIRRSTGLDAKSLYFLSYDASQIEVVELARLLLSSLHPSCIDYYRDLSKHARRKRNRNDTPQPTVQPTTSHELSSPGWTVRYEFKLGVFAEFRQEMDAACRNYETAYDSLFSPELFETIPSWSPRFNEARMLSDVIAIRIIRCLLWTRQSTAVVRSWISHRDRIRDLVDRRGKGTDGYGWQAWQSTWSRVMAEIITRSQFSVVPNVQPSTNVSSVFAAAEKSIPFGERILPWEHLHHEGYWFQQSGRYTQSRRKLAQHIPPEDRQAPGKSPASVIASKSHLYDTYLTIEPHEELPADGTPGYNYVENIISILERAIESFGRHSQLRSQDYLELRKAMEYVQTASWAKAIFSLYPLWQSQVWRKSGWWKLLQQVGWALLDCAKRGQESDLVIRLTWELSNNIFEENAKLNYDMHHALDHLDSDAHKPALSVDVSSAVSRISSSFVFATSEGHVGELVECQFSLTSRGHSNCPPVTFSQAKIVFEGSFKPIHLFHLEQAGENDDRSKLEIMDISLEDTMTAAPQRNKRISTTSIASLGGQADLSFTADQIRIFRFRVTPREAGDVSVASITLILDDSKFSLTVTNSDVEDSPAEWWESKSGGPIARKIGQHRTVSSIHILPKPPKMLVNIVGLKKAYYTNEDVDLWLDIVNDEEESIEGSIEARLISPVERAASIKWSDTEPSMTKPVQPGNTIILLPKRDIGFLASGSKTTATLLMNDTFAAVDHELEVTLRYGIDSDRETVLTKTIIVEIAVIRPFEANYEFLPQLDIEPWPSFFTSSVQERRSASVTGLKQKYLISANICSFTTEPVIIEAILLTAKKITGGATCVATTGILKAEDNQTEKSEENKISVDIQPEQNRCFEFDFLVQKMILGDRHAVNIDLALEIGWRRQESTKMNSSVLEVPRFAIPSAEPRVLLSSTPMLSVGSQAKPLRLNFVIENPSMHFLTFNIGLESSEDFAFSGPKVCAMSLVPLSRQDLVYRILPNKQDDWIRVQLNVVDAYFGQTLRVQPACAGVKLNKKGQLLVYVD